MRRALLAAAAALLVASGCSTPAPQGPGEPKVDVDTPELRSMKAAGGMVDCVPGEGEPVAGGLPEITLPCFGGGESVDLSSLRGPLVVNLWAVWCGPCRRELPIYQAFAEEYAGQVDVLGVDFNDTQTTAAMELAVDSGVTYPNLADPGVRLSGKAPFPNIQALPYLALVDEDGRVVHQEFVEIKDLGQLEDLVAEHLGVEVR